ncbi:PREDICTED: programmed cell death protein 4-like isoform X1 [Poecilia mexicana]|uniref:programmed cell death protein 4-like isoform X1 n=1 Tax=Poecilia mexicana TaxID=48701 RepID=UPI00072E387B|nr:PREDICTED: programmed cell death protein 4-like isoform X1 [Poecilia mexicana]
MATQVDAWSSAPQADGAVTSDHQPEASCPYSDDDDGLDEVEVNGNWTPQEKALHEARLKAKAKRRLRRSSSRNSTSESVSESGETPGGDPHAAKGKVHNNDRKSRTGKGRGLPKKGGAGGKGVWGAPGMVYEAEEPDVRDPNYDEAAQGDTVYETVVPEVEEKELEKMVNPIVLEYFEHGDTKEVEVLLKELNLGQHKYEFTSVAVSLSLEGKASHRELTSRLLSDLSGKMLTQGEMAHAFDKMLKELPDLILDTPEAPQMLGQFIARGIADHVLPMNFLDSYKGKVDCEHARVALDRAAVLLSMKKGMIGLDNVWGVGGGLRPVKHLVKKMNLLLKEYLISGDVSEAERCLRDLEVPHFHHELVYEVFSQSRLRFWCLFVLHQFITTRFKLRCDESVSFSSLLMSCQVNRRQSCTHESLLLIGFLFFRQGHCVFGCYSLIFSQSDLEAESKLVQNACNCKSSIYLSLSHTLATCLFLNWETSVFGFTFFFFY